jgi:hypothetical protein
VARRQISEERKAAYYIGMVISVIGGISFVSVFITGILSFGDFSNFDGRVRSEGLRAIIGMILIVVGQVIASIGRSGLAGSGVVLDPEKAREDVEPWARMTGGIVKDAADEAGVNLAHLTGGDADDLPFDEKLRRLHQLHTEGILTDEEYQQEKQKILDQA